MLKLTALYLPVELIEPASDYAKEHNTSLNALVIAHLEALTGVNALNDPLLRFSRGLITKEQAITESGVRDYAELLIAMGDVDLPIPSLTKEEIDRQVKVFTEIFKNS